MCPNSQVLNLNKQGVQLAGQGQFHRAIETLHRAAALYPNESMTHHNLGAIYHLQNNLEMACSHFEKALELEPNSAKTAYNLGNLYRTFSNSQKAAECFEKVLSLDPKHHSAGYLLKVVRGEAPNKAPKSFVQNLYDQYAPNFEKNLLNELQYKAPKLLFDLLLDFLSEAAPTKHNNIVYKRALDLGCGTGLSGQQFKPLTKEFIGVDVSPNMLKFAEEKQIYDQLICQEIHEFLKNIKQVYDLIIAADVFIYVGDLKPIFRLIKKRSHNKTLFTFSTEVTEQKNYILTQTGRYAHSKNYLEQLCNELNFTVKKYKLEHSRKECNQPVPCHLFIVEI